MHTAVFTYLFPCGFELQYGISNDYYSPTSVLSLYGPLTLDLQRTKPHLRRDTGVGGGCAVTCPSREVLLTQALLAQTLSVACDTVTGHLVSLYIVIGQTVTGHLESLYATSHRTHSHWTFRVIVQIESLNF